MTIPSPRVLSVTRARVMLLGAVGFVQCTADVKPLRFDDAATGVHAVTAQTPRDAAVRASGSQACVLELPTSPFEVNVSVPTRIHLTRSRLSLDALCPILAEMNAIWWSQAGVCFEMEIVNDDQAAPTGVDLWFEATAPFPNGTDANGVYAGAHAIYALDSPQLRDVAGAVTLPAARTAAHELGHALGLEHQNCGQACDPLLMRSGTTGFLLARGAPATVDEVQNVRDWLQTSAAVGVTLGVTSCGVQVSPAARP